MVISLMGAAAGDEESVLGSRITTLDEQWRMLERKCLASMIGPSGPSRLLECLSLSPRNANFETLSFHEELDMFAIISKSEEHPSVIAGLISLILLVL